MADDLRYTAYIGTNECLGYADSTSSKIFQTFDPYECSIVALLKPFWSSTARPGKGVISMKYIQSQWPIRIYYVTGSQDRWAFYVNPATIQSALQNFNAGKFQHIVAAWDVNNTLDGTNYLSLYINTVVSDSATALNVYTPDYIRIGELLNFSGSPGNNPFDGIIYLAILNTSLPSYLLYDDFNDNVYTSRVSGHPGYPAWTVNSGTWSAASGYLENSTDATVSIYIASTDFDDIVWEFNHKFDGLAPTKSVEFNLINESSRSATADGYLLAFNSSTNYQLYRVDNNSNTSIINMGWTADTDWHNYKVTRKANGEWEIFLDGVSGGTVTDITYTSITNIVYKTNSTVDRFDNLRSYRLADSWARDRLMMVEDLYNFSGTADTFDGKAFWVDENSLLVPKHCLDVNAVLASSNLDIVSWPSLMPDNTDYDATRHNMVNDGNMEHSGIGGWTVVGSPRLGFKDSALIRTGTQALQVHADSANEGYRQDLNSDAAGSDYYIGFDYLVHVNDVKLEILDDANAIQQTVSDIDNLYNLFYDNFDDLDYAGWTVNSGTWQATGSWLEKTATAATWESIYKADTNFTDVVWEYNFRLNTADSSSIIQFDLINTSDRGGTSDGYNLHITGSNIFELYRVDNNLDVVIIDTSWTADTNWHNAKIIRKTGGVWEVFLDGVSKGTITDNTYTSTAYIVIRSYGINSDIDDIRIATLSPEWKEYRTCYEIPVGSTGVRVQAVSNAARDSFAIDKIFCHKSLINNGGMEGTYDDESGGGGGTVNVAPGWNKYAVETDGTDTLDEETTIVHSGSSSQKVDVDASGEGVTQNFATALNKWYALSAWIFIESGEVNIKIFGDATDDASVNVTQIGSWTRANVVKRGDTDTTPLLVIRSINAAAKFYVDDVSCVELDEASPSTNTATTETSSYETSGN